VRLRTAGAAVAVAGPRADDMDSTAFDAASFLSSTLPATPMAELQVAVHLTDQGTRGQALVH
jgi:hypothetical protein